MERSSSDAETRRKAAEVGGTFAAISEVSRRISNELKQAEALEKMSRNEEAIKQAVSTNLTNLFEKRLAQKYGIEGMTALLQKSQTDENARQQVLSEYSAFINNYVKKHGDILVPKGYVDPDSVKIKSPSNTHLKDKIMQDIERGKNLSMDVGHVHVSEEMDPKKKFEMQKSLWEKIEKIKSDYIFKYGAAQFYARTGTTARKWDRWEKEVNEYFAHGGFTNLTEVADEALNGVDYIIGRVSEAMAKLGIDIGKLYLEGAKRFPNEDAPHSEAVKQLEEAGKK